MSEVQIESREPLQTWTHLSRAGTTAQALGKVRSAFPQWGNGTTTGGNASQVTDGAAAVVLMRRSKAEELGVNILAKYVTTAVAGEYSILRRRYIELILWFLGVAPRIMGIGPSVAIPKVLGQAGISKEDVDLFEVIRLNKSRRSGD